MGTEQEAVYILRSAPAFIHSTLRRKEGAVLAVQAVALSTPKSGSWIKHKDNLFLCPFSCDCHFFFQGTAPLGLYVIRCFKILYLSNRESIFIYLYFTLFCSNLATKSHLLFLESYEESGAQGV